MKASETKLQPILEGTKQYVVPMFQRTYSWDRKEWSVLWEDLADLMGETDPRPHFIGSIVTMPARTVPEGVAKYLLIDGQQRLTTILILLSAVRDRAKTMEGHLAAQIEELLLTNRYQAGNDVYKLLPTQGDRDSFIDIVRGDVTTLRDDSISKAYQYFERHVRALSSERVEKLREMIVSKLILVSIVLEHDDNPHLIFESLNAKGRPLSQADLIRNYFFMRLPFDAQEHLYFQVWRPMQERLRDDLTEFIRHFLMKDGDVVKQTDVYFALKAKCDPKSMEDVRAYLRQISDFSELYSALLRPDEEPDQDIRERLLRLNRIDMTVAYPFLLNVYRDWRMGALTKDEYLDVLAVLENFMIRRFVCGVPTHSLNKLFPPLYAQARRHTGFSTGVREQLAMRNYPPDAEFRERMASAKLYGSGERQVRTKLILEILEKSFDHHEEVPFSSLTIEHVMPQTVSPRWKADLGEGWETTHAVWLDTIGNLTLSGYNSEMSNSEFTKKKTILAESHVELNRYFVSLDKWDEAAIRSRGENLADRALRVWPAIATSASSSRLLGDVTGRTPAAVVVLGERQVTTTWRDVATKTLETIASVDPDSFERISNELPRFVNRDGNALRTPRALSNGSYMEVNLSAAAVYKLCLQAITVAGLTGDDWAVEVA
ncbi:MAG: DUF262 domain-containing protein [Acidobacteriota bacterium]|nr:DUF262 domain-containing protein [Acidobacteriota bacterium]